MTDVNEDNISVRKPRRSVTLTAPDEDVDESKGNGGKCGGGNVLPPPRMATKGGGSGRGLALLPPMQLIEGIKTSNGSSSSTESSDEEVSSSGSEAKRNISDTMADVVMLVKSKKDKKKKDTSGTTSVGTDSVPVLHIPKLSKIERTGVICVLEDCIDQLYILGKANKKPTVPPDLLYESLEERFSERERTKVNLEETEGKAEALRDSKKIIKLQRDRATLERVLQMTLDDLKSKKSFKTLVEITELEIKKQNEEAELISAEEKNMKEVNNLRNTLKTEFKEGMDKINEKHEIIAKLKDEIQDTLFMNDLKFKYVSNWEKAREEQNSERLSLSEKTLEDQIIDVKDNMDMELRCHVEIESYVKQAITNLEAEIEKWMEKYDSELEQRADDLQRLRAKRSMEYEELEELALLHQQRQNEINAYLAHKEKAAAEAAHLAYLSRMATLIQAWWRGTMVRRGLGPYKKSKKGKDKKGKGKGGKGGSRKKK